MNYWSKEELKILRTYYSEHGRVYVKHKLDEIGFERSLEQIRHKANHEKIKYLNGFVFFCDEEKEVIKKYYPDYGPKYTQDELKKCGYERDTEAIKSFAQRNKLRFQKIIAVAWTEDEISVIEKYYEKYGSREVQKELKNRGYERTRKSICDKAELLHIKIRNRWSNEDLRILNEYYPVVGRKVIELFNNKKTDNEIIWKVKRLGIKFRSSVWSKGEDEILVKYYSTEGINIVERLDGKSKKQVKRRAEILGLKHGIWWLEKEIDILKQHYEELGYKVKTLLSGRSIGSIRRKANSLGLKKLSYPFSKEEDELIIKYYPSMGIACCSLLNGRTHGQVHRRVAILGVKCCAFEQAKTKNKTKWSPGELEILNQFYPKLGIRVLELLPGKNNGNIIYKKEKLNLKFDVRYQVKFPVKIENCRGHFSRCIGRIKRDKVQGDYVRRSYDVFECVYCGKIQETPLYIDNKYNIY